MKLNQAGRGRTAPLLLVLAASLLAGLLTPTPTLGAPAGKVSEICLKSTDAAFRAKYCAAAKDLRKGYSANLATSAVWTGVSVACGAACGKAAGGIACSIAGSGGTAGEGVITKKFSDSLAQEGMKWGAQAMKGKDSAATTAAAAPAGESSTEKGGVNAEACQAAGTSALKAYGKYTDAKQTDKSLTQLRAEVQGLNTPTQANVATFSPDANVSDAANAGGANTFAANADTNGLCGDASIGTALGAIRCAASADPSLPPYVKSETFLKDLQKATGQSPDAFFAAFESPAKSIFDSPVAAGLSENQQRGLADSLGAMEAYSERKSESAALAKSGGGRSPLHDTDTGFDMNGMIAGVLGQMGGAVDLTLNGGSPEAKLAAARAPASVAGGPEDRKTSIFDRVQFRYGAVSARDHLEAP